MIKKLFIFLCAATLIVSGSFFSTAEAQLTAPTLSATAVSNSQINLSWTDYNNGVYGYVIERSLNPSSGFVTIANADRKATSYNNVGLNSGTTYYYRITAYKKSESSPYSNIVSATTQAGASVPNTPSNLSASAVSSSQIYLAWQDNSSNETGFKIQRATSSGGPWSQVATVGANATSYSNTSLSASTTYYYRVLAYNSAGNSSYSNTASATTQSGGSATIPLAPSNLTATAVSSSQITLAWQDNSSNETGFNIQRATSSGGPWTQIATVGANVSSYSNTGLSASTTYYYRVLAYNSTGNSSYSNTASATTQSGGSYTVPNAPSNLNVNAVSSSQINLAWQDNSNNETSFEIWRYQSGIGWITLPFQSANVTSYADTGLSPSTLHYYVVRAVNSAGVSSWSNVASATTLSGPGSGDTTPPSVSITSPSSGSTYTTPQTVTIYAYASDNVGVTKVEFYDNGVLKGTDTTYQYTYAWTFTSSNNGTHSWTAKAYDAAGNVKTSTAVSLTVNVTAADTTPPTTPALTASAVSCSQVNLSWTASTDSGGSGLKGYNVYRGGAFLKQVLAPSTSTSDTGLSASSSYTYRVSAIDNAGNESAQSNVAVTSTSACADTIAPTVSITSPASGVTYATAQTATVTASASDNVGVTRVEFYDNGVLKGTDTTNVYTYAWTFDTANNGTHNWTAKAYDAAGNMRTSTAVSVTVNIAASTSTPSAPSTLVATAISGNRINLTWQDNSTNETGFMIYRGTSPSGPFARIATLDSNITSYSDTDLIPWTGYYYRIFAFNSLGASAYSNTASATTLSDYDWALGIGGLSYYDNVYITDSAVDGQGNVYVVGSFNGSIDFGGGYLASSSASDDIFVVKYSPTGRHLWSKRLGGDGVDKAYSIAVDSMNNVVVIGYFQGSVDFGGGYLTSNGTQNAFIVKYSPAGAHLWSERYGGDSTFARGTSVIIDSNDNIYATGDYTGSIDFGGGTFYATPRAIFLVKLRNDGTHVWSTNFGGQVSAIYSTDLAVDPSGNIVATGYFYGTMSLGNHSLTSHSTDAFLVKYSSSGTYMWARSFGNYSGTWANGVDCDSSGNVILTGSFRELVDFGGGLLGESSWKSIFLSKYSPAGSHIWSESFKTSSNIAYREGYASDVVVDNDDNIIFTGTIEYLVDFGSGYLSGTQQDMFIAKFSPLGENIWAKRRGDAADERGVSVSVDMSNNIVATGYFQGTMDFGGDLLSSGSLTNGYVVKFLP